MRVPAAGLVVLLVMVLLVSTEASMPGDGERLSVSASVCRGQNASAPVVLPDNSLWLVCGGKKHLSPSVEVLLRQGFGDAVFRAGSASVLDGLPRGADLQEQGTPVVVRSLVEGPTAVHERASLDISHHLAPGAYATFAAWVWVGDDTAGVVSGSKRTVVLENALGVGNDEAVSVDGGGVWTVFRSIPRQSGILSPGVLLGVAGARRRWFFASQSRGDAFEGAFSQSIVRPLRWTHLAIVVRPGRMLGYVDGRLEVRLGVRDSKAIGMEQHMFWKAREVALEAEWSGAGGSGGSEAERGREFVRSDVAVAAKWERRQAAMEARQQAQSAAHAFAITSAKRALHTQAPHGPTRSVSGALLPELTPEEAAEEAWEEKEEERRRKRGLGGGEVGEVGGGVGGEVGEVGGEVLREYFVPLRPPQQRRMVFGKGPGTRALPLLLAGVMEMYGSEGRSEEQLNGAATPKTLMRWMRATKPPAPPTWMVALFAAPPPPQLLHTAQHVTQDSTQLAAAATHYAAACVGSTKRVSIEDLEAVMRQEVQEEEEEEDGVVLEMGEEEAEGKRLEGSLLQGWVRVGDIVPSYLPHTTQPISFLRATALGTTLAPSPRSCIPPTLLPILAASRYDPNSKLQRKATLGRILDQVQDPKTKARISLWWQLLGALVTGGTRPRVDIVYHTDQQLLQSYPPTSFLPKTDNEEDDVEREEGERDGERDGQGEGATTTPLLPLSPDPYLEDVMRLWLLWWDVRFPSSSPLPPLAPLPLPASIGDGWSSNRVIASWYDAPDVGFCQLLGGEGCGVREDGKRVVENEGNGVAWVRSTFPIQPALWRLKSFVKALPYSPPTELAVLPKEAERLYHALHSHPLQEIAPMALGWSTLRGWGDGDAAPSPPLPFGESWYLKGGIPRPSPFSNTSYPISYLRASGVVYDETHLLPYHLFNSTLHPPPSHPPRIFPMVPLDGIHMMSDDRIGPVTEEVLMGVQSMVSETGWGTTVWKELLEEEEDESVEMVVESVGLSRGDCRAGATLLLRASLLAVQWHDSAKAKHPWDTGTRLSEASLEKTMGERGDEDSLKVFNELEAAGGDDRAAVWLGQRLYWGRGGVQRDPVRAAQYFQGAAAQGNRVAEYNLGVMQLRGEGGMEPNHRQALRHFARAADAGYAPALTGLADAHLNPPRSSYAEDGEGEEGGGEEVDGFEVPMKRNVTKAVELLRQACERGSEDGCHSLGRLLSRGSKDLHADGVRAFKYLATAAALGSRAAFSELAGAALRVGSWADDADALVLRGVRDLVHSRNPNRAFYVEEEDDGELPFALSGIHVSPSPLNALTPDAVRDAHTLAFLGNGTRDVLIENALDILRNASVVPFTGPFPWRSDGAEVLIQTVGSRGITERFPACRSCALASRLLRAITPITPAGFFSRLALDRHFSRNPASSQALYELAALLGDGIAAHNVAFQQQTLSSTPHNLHHPSTETIPSQLVTAEEQKAKRAYLGIPEPVDEEVEEEEEEEGEEEEEVDEEEVVVVKEEEEEEGLVEEEPNIVVRIVRAVGRWGLARVTNWWMIARRVLRDVVGEFRVLGTLLWNRMQALSRWNRQNVDPNIVVDDAVSTLEDAQVRIRFLAWCAADASNSMALAGHPMGASPRVLDPRCGEELVGAISSNERSAYAPLSSWHTFVPFNSSHSGEWLRHVTNALSWRTAILHSSPTAIVSFAFSSPTPLNPTPTSSYLNTAINFLYSQHHPSTQNIASYLRQNAPRDSVEEQNTWSLEAALPWWTAGGNADSQVFRGFSLANLSSPFTLGFLGWVGGDEVIAQVIERDWNAVHGLDTAILKTKLPRTDHYLSFTATRSTPFPLPPSTPAPVVSSPLHQTGADIAKVMASIGEGVADVLDAISPSPPTPHLTLARALERYRALTLLTTSPSLHPPTPNNPPIPPSSTPIGPLKVEDVKSERKVGKEGGLERKGEVQAMLEKCFGQDVGMEERECGEEKVLGLALVEWVRERRRNV